MEDFGKFVLEWLGSNWGWVVVILSVFVEIVPVKLHPLSALMRWIGKKLNGEVREDIKDIRKDIKNLDERIDKLDNRLDEQEKELAEFRISCIKRHVLDFANSCRHGEGHTKEDFANLMAENSEYEVLVKKLEKTNDVYTADFEFIKAKYRECQENNSFLA